MTETLPQVLITGSGVWGIQFSVSQFATAPWRDPVLLPPASEWPTAGTIIRPPQVAVLSATFPQGTYSTAKCIDLVVDQVSSQATSEVPSAPLFVTNVNVYYNRPFGQTITPETCPQYFLSGPSVTSYYQAAEGILHGPTIRLYYELGYYDLSGFFPALNTDWYDTFLQAKAIIEQARPGQTFVTVNSIGDIVIPSTGSSMLPDLLVLNFGTPDEIPADSYQATLDEVVADEPRFPSYSVHCYDVEKDAIGPTALYFPLTQLQITGNSWFVAAGSINADTNLPDLDTTAPVFPGDHWEYLAAGGDPLWISYSIWESYMGGGGNPPGVFVPPAEVSNGPDTITRGGIAINGYNPGTSSQSIFIARQEILQPQGVDYNYEGQYTAWPVQIDSPTLSDAELAVLNAQQVALAGAGIARLIAAYFGFELPPQSFSA
jgi:hypothetical protein